MISKVKAYCAVALEWYQTGSGRTPEQALQSLEHLLLATAALKMEHPTGREPGPAPEDYQRVATSGEIFLSTHRGWNEMFGRNQWPIVRRGVIDMGKSKFRIVTKDPSC